MCSVCVHSILYVMHVLSNQDVSHKQSSDGGQGQFKCGASGQTGGRVTEVGVAACFGHRVGSGVGIRGEVHLWRLVAVGFCQTALHLDIDNTHCWSNATEAVFSTGTCCFSGKTDFIEANTALVALQRVNDCKAESEGENLQDDSVHLGRSVSDVDAPGLRPL